MDTIIFRRPPLLKVSVYLMESTVPVVFILAGSDRLFTDPKLA